ncbi:hypothetical protein TSOC_001418 [Tetrabaena socialis]|uniref:GST C-terminal domain-containing protein n=1 Tax=Tetrabaena socialis TaxID=47790 RepID=A0A2J8AGS3_9CHLO|nr:hypothetical protein TSOC_001418 [Tetrabaena socialis]|eukprot:PNH11720.1 hypothetical protein TSOC_001418 [Tetrabaena socialis]
MYAGSSLASKKSWKAKTSEATLLDTALGLARQYALPLAVLGFLARRFLASRKKADKPKPDAAASKAADAVAPASTSARKPRREYKVKRDQEGPLLVGADDRETVEVQPHDDVMEAYDESEVEAAGAAAAGPGGSNEAMLKMLQQMGYKVVMPKDGSGQVFLVPPGAKGGPGGEEAIEEGDEEGYDEDEEAYEGEDGEEDDLNSPHQGPRDPATMATDAAKATVNKDVASGFRSFIEEGGRFAPEAQRARDGRLLLAPTATNGNLPALAPRRTAELEAGRYHLYVSLACPFACRCLAVLHMKGLDHVIGASNVHPTMQRTRPDDPKDEHVGWVFREPTDPPIPSATGHGSFGCEGCTPDTVNGAKFVRDLYEKAKDTTGKYSVPVLWDKKEGTIVNNESAEIMRMLNSAFNHLATNPDLDLYPEPLREAIDQANAWIAPSLNMKVYGCGFATAQQAYDIAFKELFEALDRCEQVLSRQRYIAGGAVTEADIRLFQTLIRFDEAYFVLYKCNKRLIRDYPHMAGYVRELFQLPGIGRTVNMHQIRVGYFTSKPNLNPYAIVPGGGEAWQVMLDSVFVYVRVTCNEEAQRRTAFEGHAQCLMPMAIQSVLPGGLSVEEDDYVRQVSLTVLQQARGSNVFFADLEYLAAALAQGRVAPSELDPPRPTLSRSTFATQTAHGVRSIDLLKTTGVNWVVPRGFLKRYNAVSHLVLRAAAAAAGARHDGALDVVTGVWGRVEVAAFVEACRQVVEGGLSPEEEEYVAALASEQVPPGTAYIRDLPYLDKCLQQGRTPTSIKGPELLPTVFLSNTTSGDTGMLALRNTGGRVF